MYHGECWIYTVGKRRKRKEERNVVQKQVLNDIKSQCQRPTSYPATVVARYAIPDPDTPHSKRAERQTAPRFIFIISDHPAGMIFHGSRSTHETRTHRHLHTRAYRIHPITRTGTPAIGRSTMQGEQSYRCQPLRNPIRRGHATHRIGRCSAGHQ